MTRPQLSLTLWDWETSWQDLPALGRLCDTFAGLGGTTLETTVPWHLTEPKPGRHDFSGIHRRMEIIRRSGLDARLRLNFQDPPQWADVPPARFENGEPFVKGYGLPPALMPSLFDSRTLTQWMAWASKAGEQLEQWRPTYSLGVGLHFELKFGEWTGYESPAENPPSYEHCETIPSAPHVTAWVARRRQRLRQVVENLASCVRATDPEARFSAPLGEGFRSESAQFSNQDVYGLSRHADEIIYSHDFFLHGPDLEWQAETAVAVYTSGTGKPVHLEIDGTGTQVFQRYGVDALVDHARAAFQGGAIGLNLANFAEGLDPERRIQSLALIPRLADLELPEKHSRPVVHVFMLPDTFEVSRDRSEVARARAFGLFDAARRAGYAAQAVLDIEQLKALPAGNTLVIPTGTVVSSAAADVLRGRVDLAMWADEPLELTPRGMGPLTGLPLEGRLADYSRFDRGRVPEPLVLN
ncbi:MAG: beta-galactosidase [Microbacteriaceae bacterium]|nr:beta-galactosidase [Microbacteriaceae bacterium]